MRTIVVSGPIANKPGNGGIAWVPVSYVRGLRRMGFDAVFIEQLSGSADGSGSSETEAASWFERVTRATGISDTVFLLREDGAMVVGSPTADLVELVDSAELLVNISGHLTIPALRRSVRRAAYVDLDPGFTQFWHAQGNPGPRLEGHDVHFTVGANLGTDSCTIPSGGIRWVPMRPPVVLDDWPASDPQEPLRFTTVASWRGPFGPITHDGRTYGLKVHEFRRFADLPGRVPGTFEIALDIHPADGKDLELLRRHGWQITDPAQVAGGPLEFRRYVQESWAEFSVAQGLYADTGSGWFSDRSVRYLASGRPVLIQDTGIGRTLPIGEGLMVFRTPDEAVAGAREIANDYDRHAKAARALAEEFFDSDRVLVRMLEEAGVDP
jgi:hypothetical protein